MHSPAAFPAALLPGFLISTGFILVAPWPCANSAACDCYPGVRITRPCHSMFVEVLLLPVETRRAFGHDSRPPNIR